MANGFFIDVLEVESVDTRKNRDPRNQQELTYARLRCAGGTLSVRVRDGVKILPGWSGKASGSCRIGILKREWNNRLSDVVAMIPFELDTWVPGVQLSTSNQSAMESFLKK